MTTLRSPSLLLPNNRKNGHPLIQSLKAIEHPSSALVMKALLTVGCYYYLNRFTVGHKFLGKEVHPPNQSRKPAAHQASVKIIQDSHKLSIKPTFQFNSEEFTQIKDFFNGKQPV